VTLAFGIAIYFIVWWTVLFAVLPIGVRTSEEAGEKTTPGNAESAPHMPNLLPKMVATTRTSRFQMCFIRLPFRQFDKIAGDSILSLLFLPVN